MIQGVFDYDESQQLELLYSESRHLMKKIFLYTDTSIAGGAEKHMQLLARNLLRDGYSITVICSHSKTLDAWCESMEQDAIRVIRLKVGHKHDPRHYVLLKKILQQEKPDILHLHLWNPGACRYAFLAASSKESKEMKIISTEHDPFQLQGLKKSFKKGTFKKTNLTIAVSRSNGEQMLKWYPQIEGKVVVIHNGIDLEAFEQQLRHYSQQEKIKIRTELFQAKSQDFIITTIAALHPRKGLLFLLDAFAKVRENLGTRDSLKLVIIGEGPQKKILEQKIRKLKLKETVVLLGYQENIPKILKSSDLFVLPSLKEAFGLVLLEAMAAQLPIIASNVGGIPEIIEDQKSGMLVEPGKSDLLAEKITMFIKNAPLRQKLAFLGYHRVKEFDLKKMVQKTEEVYNSVL